MKILRIAAMALTAAVLAHGLCGQTTPSYTVSSGDIPGGYEELHSIFSGWGAAGAPMADDQLSWAIMMFITTKPVFFGVPQIHQQVGSNGYAVLGGLGTTASTTPDFSTAPGKVLAPCWLDLDPGAGGEIGFLTAYSGLFVEWRDVKVKGSNERVAMQLMVNAAGVIEFRYGSPSFGTAPSSVSGVTVGISGPSGTAQEIIYGHDPGYVSNGTITSWPVDRYIRFTPTAAAANSPPKTTVTMGGEELLYGQTLEVLWNTPISALNLGITVSDANGDASSLSGGISNASSMPAGQFSSAVAAVPYTLVPTTGSFNTFYVSCFLAFEGTDPAGSATMRDFFVIFNVVPPPNAPPAISLTSNGTPIASGATLNVPLNSNLAAMGLQIGVTDADGHDADLTAQLFSVTTEGLVVAQFSSSAQATPFSLNPSTGIFNVPNALLVILLTAHDQGQAAPGTGVFNVRIRVSSGANAAPNIAVTSNGAPVLIGSTLHVTYGSTLFAMDLRIWVSDPNNDNTSVVGTVSNVTNQGIPNGEFSSASAATPYVLLPTSGIFTQAAGSTHIVVLTANDGSANTVFTFTIAAQPMGAAPAMNVTEGSASGPAIGHAAAPSGDRAFGSWFISAGPTAALSVVITNTGTGTLSVGAPTLGGADPGEFTLAGGGPAALNPGQSATFGVAFDPSSIGAKSAIIYFTHNDTTQVSPYEVHVSGTGTQIAPLTILTSVLPEGYVNVPYGPAALQAAGGIGPYQWTVGAGTVLPPGLSLTAGAVTGTPTAAGNYSFVVVVTDSASNSVPAVLSITVQPHLPISGSGGGARGSGGGCVATTGDWSLIVLAAALALLCSASLRRRRA